MILKPQDVLVLLKVVSLGSFAVRYSDLAEAIGMSPSEVHAAIGRAQKARLYASETRRAIAANLVEFLVHGVKYSFPADLGSRTRGIPTASAAGPLRDLIVSNDPLPPVWPSADGAASGLAVSPLYRSVPKAASQDTKLYELLALVDAIRIGRTREKRIATELLRDRIRGLN